MLTSIVTPQPAGHHTPVVADGVGEDQRAIGHAGKILQGPAKLLVTQMVRDEEAEAEIKAPVGKWKVHRITPDDLSFSYAQTARRKRPQVDVGENRRETEPIRHSAIRASHVQRSASWQQRDRLADAGRDPRLARQLLNQIVEHRDRGDAVSKSA